MEISINILDKTVNEYYETNLSKEKDGIILSIFNSENKELYTGSVWPNNQYEYDSEASGQYKVCIKLTNSMFKQGTKMIKTQVKFASDFHRDKKEKKKG